MGRVKIRVGENEIDIEGSDDFIKKHIEEFYFRVGGASATARHSLKEQLLTPAAVAKPGGRAFTPAEFYKQKGKTDGVSQILIFGKYLEQFRNQSEFTRKELNALAKEAKLSKDIHAQYFTNAVKQGLLRKQGEKYSLTLSAEELLASV